MKLLTFLGTGFYEETTYSIGEKDVKTKFIQEALVESLGNEVEVIVFLTEEAKKDPNWIGGQKHNRRSGNTEYQKGLREILESRGIKHAAVDILNGKDNDEMWDNFETIYNTTSEKDQIYVDITHSFRSIPIIFMSVLNYAKFTKGIELKGIYYGAFEAKEDGKAPVFDLSLFDSINDWTVGADKLITTGDGDMFTELTNKILAPVLKEAKDLKKDAVDIRRLNDKIMYFTKSLKSSRGNLVSKDGLSLKRELEKLKEIKIKELKPFTFVIGKIFEKVQPYSGSIVEDIHYTVCLCRDLGLIQQAYTLLIENILTYLSEKRGADIYDTDSRNLTKDILMSRHNYMGEKVNLFKEHYSEEYISYIKQEEAKLDKYLSHDIAQFYNLVSVNYRNDLNHGGYRGDAKNYKNLSDDLGGFILEFEKLILKKGEN